MNNKFLVFTNIYDCTGYSTGFTLLENVVLLAFPSQLSFAFIKLSIKAPLWNIVEDQYFRRVGRL